MVASAEAKSPAHSNKSSKINSKAKQKKKTKKRNAAKKVKTKRSSENNYLNITVNLHCANSILSKQKQPFSKFASVSRANLENTANYKRVKFRNTAKLTDTKD